MLVQKLRPKKKNKNTCYCQAHGLFDQMQFRLGDMSTSKYKDDQIRAHLTVQFQTHEVMTLKSGSDAI